MFLNKVVSFVKLSLNEHGPFFNLVVLMLSSQFSSSFLILGKPGTCEKYGQFQCTNGQCILKHFVCDSYYTCGDKSDESKTGGAVCGIFLDFFVSLIGILSLPC